MSSSKTLCLFSSPFCSYEAVEEMSSILHVSAKETCFVTKSGGILPGELPTNQFTGAVSFGIAGHHTADFLSLVAAAVQPGSTIVIQEVSGGAESQASLTRAILLSGLTNVKTELSGSTVLLTTQKPLWNTGAKSAISLKTKSGSHSAANPPPPVTAPKPALWTVRADEDDDDLIDEEELLTEDDLKPVVPARSGGDDCEVGASGRQACKNCTCGRAEGKEVKLTKEMLENPQSGCGSCGLGDGFRCAGCPYRGLPPFQMGKKIQLPSDFLMADL